MNPPKTKIISKINQLLKQAKLSEKDYKDWQGYLAQVPEQYLNSVLGIFLTLPARIVWFNELIKRKKMILETKDKKAWLDLLQEEEKAFENLAEEE